MARITRAAVDHPLVPLTRARAPRDECGAGSFTTRVPPLLVPGQRRMRETGDGILYPKTIASNSRGLKLDSTPKRVGVMSGKLRERETTMRGVLLCTFCTSAHLHTHVHICVNAFVCACSFDDATHRSRSRRA